MVNTKNTKRPVEEKNTSESDNTRLLQEFRKENARLHNLIAKKQVAHESEVNKLRAEHAEELAKVKANSVTLNILPVAAKNGKPA